VECNLKDIQLSYDVYEDGRLYIFSKKNGKGLIINVNTQDIEEMVLK